MSVISKLRSKASSMSVESWKSLFDHLAVVLLLLTFGVGVGALYFGNRVDDKQKVQLRQFDKDLIEAKTQLGVQQTRAAEAERQLELVKKKQAPRGVPMAVISATRDKPHGKVLMEYLEGSPETRLFTQGLWEELNMAGWNIPKPTAIFSTPEEGISLSDIIFFWPYGTNPETQLPAYKTLWDAFSAAGYGVGGVASKKVPTDTLLLVVGPRI
jgi:hypothetical protein